MTDDAATWTVLFPELFDKPIVATSDQSHASSHGGAILLKAAESRYGILGDLARRLIDERRRGKVRDTLRDLLAQRIFGLAWGHPDANDADRLADDPIHKLLLDRDPVAAAPLASEPSASRFENGVGRTALWRMGRDLAAPLIDRHRERLQRRARRITIDLGPTDDPANGAQQLSFFSGHYDTWCYLPIVGFLTFDDEAAQYLSAAILRPGKAPAHPGRARAAAPHAGAAPGRLSEGAVRHPPRRWVRLAGAARLARRGAAGRVSRRDGRKQSPDAGCRCPDADRPAGRRADAPDGGPLGRVPLPGPDVAGAASPDRSSRGTSCASPAARRAATRGL